MNQSTDLHNNSVKFEDEMKGQLLIKGTFPGTIEWPLYTGLTVHLFILYIL
jgi:hypothetical protein